VAVFETKKRILCYGDSNTWGYVPSLEEPDRRFPSGIRWTGRLQHSLGSGYLVIEEGLNSRTTDVDDPDQEGKNGLAALVPVLRQNLPLDVLVLALGSNDLKDRYKRTPDRIAEGVEHLVVAVQGALSPGTAIVVLSPSIPIFSRVYEAYSYAGLEAKARALAPLFRSVAEKRGAHFVDLALHVKSSQVDGVHLDPEQHQAVAELLRPLIFSIANASTLTTR
jgi:lysophospholipase L1-like esterase